MEENQALLNCFIIQVFDDYLVYSPLTGISAFLNRTGILELRNQLEVTYEGMGNPNSKLFKFAQDILQSPVQVPVRKEGDVNPEFLGIIPTRSCNSACAYCDFGAQKASTRKMSYQIATKAVDWYANLLKVNHRNVLEIHFFGGEPMTAKDVIEVTLQRARLVAMEKDLIPFFEISTNGQYNAGNSRFMGQYFNKIILSLDGFKEIHNRHRPLKENKSSFENAIETAKIISDSNAELCIRCCVSRENILLMEEITEWLCNNFRLSTINFEVLFATSQADSAGLFPPDPVDFAINFEKSREIANGFGVDVVYASDISGQPLVSSCPVGKDVVIVSPDGRISNCYLMQERWQEAGLDLDFGIMESDGNVRVEADKIDAIRKMVEDKPRCRKCFCQWSCAGGCHVGNTYPGSSLKYTDFCMQTRLISAFTLLSELGLQKTIEELICTPSALQNIACNPTDHIQELNY